MADIESLVAELPPYDGTDAGVLEKYRGMTPEQLAMLYPLVRELREKELTSARDGAIEAGLHHTAVVPAGQRMDWTPYRVPGDRFHAISHRAEPIGDGATEYRFISVDPEQFPDVYARVYEEIWLLDRLDEAGIEEGR